MLRLLDGVLRLVILVDEVPCSSDRCGTEGQPAVKCATVFRPFARVVAPRAALLYAAELFFAFAYGRRPAGKYCPFVRGAALPELEHGFLAGARGRRCQSTEAIRAPLRETPTTGTAILGS